MWAISNFFVVVILLCFQTRVYSMATQAIFITELPEEGLLLNEGWKYMPGDSLQWAASQWDDSQWQHINPAEDIHDLPVLWNNRTGWFRLRFSLDSTLTTQSLALLVEQTGATEYYLNGKLIEKYGHLSNEQAGVQAVSPPFGEFISLQPGTQGEQVLAVRFALQQGIPYVLFVGNPNRALALKIITIKGVTRLTRNEVYFLDYVKASLFFILTLLHLVLFLFSPERKANLYFFIFSVMSMLNFFLHAINTQYVHLVSLKMLLLIFYSFLYISSSFFFLLATYSVFRQSRGLVFRILTVAFLLTIPLFLWSYRIGWWLSLVLYPILAFLESARIALLADQKKMRGARVVTYGAISFLFFYPLFHAIFFGLLPAGPNSLFQHMAFNLGILSLPVSISIYLATEASFTSRSLATKLVEVEQLSERTLIQEEEKKHLQQMDELKSHFFANISHEFRTPLSLIRGTVEQLIKKDSDPLQRQSGYRAIDHSASRLLQMINQLLDLSRLESGKLPLHLQPGNLSELLKLLGGSFASLYESKGITYRYTVPLQPVWVQLDREKLEQIINNLLSNAAKFTQAKGQVNFTATIHTLDTHTCSLHILVQDTGIGIPTTQLPLIFDRFYQADSSPTRNYEGSGIGLALVKELVALHGGKIEVESIESKGSTFTIQLPYLLADPTMMQVEAETLAPENPDTPATAGQATGTGILRSKKTADSKLILVIEDNMDLRRFIAGFLSESYHVQEAADGKDGYSSAIETIPDLIISDIMMPGMDGISLCHKLKQDERTGHIPIILLTAKADEQSKLDSLSTGADDYLTKPFSAEELLMRVHNLIRQRHKLKEKYNKALTWQPIQIATASADEQFLQKVLSIMEENIGNTEFDVDAFSRSIGMSRAQLNRKLSALLDQSPNEFIRTMRLKRAAALLSQQKGNIAEIAFMVGFSNPNYFTKCFRDYYGLAPSEYLVPDNQRGK